MIADHPNQVSRFNIHSYEFEVTSTEPALIN